MRKVIIGFIAGVLFATAGTAMADTVIKKVSATIRGDYSLELDGETVQLKNDPLVYNGSSYLPLREVAEIVDTEVSFDDGVISLTTTTETTEPTIPSEDEEDGGVPLTLEQYKSKLNSLEGYASWATLQLKMLNESLRRSDAGEVVLTAEEYETKKTYILDIQAKLAETEQQIADLKAAYPQYAELEAAQ